MYDEKEGDYWFDRGYQDFHYGEPYNPPVPPYDEDYEDGWIEAADGY